MASPRFVGCTVSEGVVFKCCGVVGWREGGERSGYLESVVGSLDCSIWQTGRRVCDKRGWTDSDSELFR